MKRRAPAPIAPLVAEPFEVYLAFRPAPVDGWASDPHAVRVRAVLYVRQYGLAETRSAYEVADFVAAAWLRAN